METLYDIHSDSHFGFTQIYDGPQDLGLKL